MARYVDEYVGISGHPEPPGGRDPNFRGRYRGMRMGAGPGQAAYGWYRWRHADELGGNGGFAGRSRRGERGAEAYGTYPSRPRTYDWELGGGGVRDARHDRQLVHDFNANSPALRGEGRPQGRYGVDYRERGSHPVPGPTENRFGYTNRGLGSAGFSESWAPSPGRGSRAGVGYRAARSTR